MSAAPGGARGRPGCPRRCARCAPLPRLPGGSRRAPAIAALIPSPICLLLAASEDFSSRPASSLPFTHARAHTSPTPLPPSPGFSGERQLDAMIHLQQSSLRRATPRVPRLAQVCEAPVWTGSEQARRLCAQPPSPREASAFPQLAHRSPLVPSPTPGRRRLRVHLAATPDQLQPRDPAFKCSRPSSSQPTRCHSKASRVLQGRGTLCCPPVTGAPAPSPARRCEFQHQTQASRCRLCHFAKGGSEKEQNKGRGPRKQIQIARRKRSQEQSKAPPL